MRFRFLASFFLILFVCLTSALATSEASAQELTRLQRERGRGMLRAVQREIERRYYDPSFRGVDLAARADELDARIQRAAKFEEVIGLIARLPGALNDAHTFFVPPQLPVAVSYGWSMGMIGDSCYVRRVEAGSDAARQGVAPGDRVLSINGDVPSRENLWEILYLTQVLKPRRYLDVTLRSPSGIDRALRLA